MSSPASPPGRMGSAGFRRQGEGRPPWVPSSRRRGRFYSPPRGRGGSADATPPGSFDRSRDMSPLPPRSSPSPSKTSSSVYDPINPTSDLPQFCSSPDSFSPSAPGAGTFSSGSHYRDRSPAGREGGRGGMERDFYRGGRNHQGRTWIDRDREWMRERDRPSRGFSSGRDWSRDRERDRGSRDRERERDLERGSYRDQKLKDRYADRDREREQNERERDRVGIRSPVEKPRRSASRDSAERDTVDGVKDLSTTERLSDAALPGNFASAKPSPVKDGTTRGGLASTQPGSPRNTGEAGALDQSAESKESSTAPPDRNGVPLFGSRKNRVLRREMPELELERYEERVPEASTRRSESEHSKLKFKKFRKTDHSEIEGRLPETPQLRSRGSNGANEENCWERNSISTTPVAPKSSDASALEEIRCTEGEDARTSTLRQHEGRESKDQLKQSGGHIDRGVNQKRVFEEDEQEVKGLHPKKKEKKPKESPRKKRKIITESSSNSNEDEGKSKETEEEQGARQQRKRNTIAEETKPPNSGITKKAKIQQAVAEPSGLKNVLGLTLEQVLGREEELFLEQRRLTTDRKTYYCLYPECAREIAAQNLLRHMQRHKRLDDYGPIGVIGERSAVRGRGRGTRGGRGRRGRGRGSSSATAVAVRGRRRGSGRPRGRLVKVKDSAYGSTDDDYSDSVEDFADEDEEDSDQCTAVANGREMVEDSDGENALIDNLVRRSSLVLPHTEQRTLPERKSIPKQIGEMDVDSVDEFVFITEPKTGQATTEIDAFDHDAHSVRYDGGKESRQGNLCVVGGATFLEETKEEKDRRERGERSHAKGPRFGKRWMAREDQQETLLDTPALLSIKQVLANRDLIQQASSVLSRLKVDDVRLVDCIISEGERLDAQVRALKRQQQAFGDLLCAVMLGRDRQREREEEKMHELEERQKEIRARARTEAEVIRQRKRTEDTEQQLVANRQRLQDCEASLLESTNTIEELRNKLAQIQSQQIQSQPHAQAPGTKEEGEGLSSGTQNTDPEGLRTARPDHAREEPPPAPSSPGAVNALIEFL